MSLINNTNINENHPSLCIPRTFSNISRSKIYDTIHDLELGLIDRIDMVPKTNEKGDKFQRIFIHFQHWYDNENANKARDLLLSGKEIKVIYDVPWFWKISANRAVNNGSQNTKGNPQIKYYTNSEKKDNLLLKYNNPEPPINKNSNTCTTSNKVIQNLTYAETIKNKIAERARLYYDDGIPRSPSTSPPPHPWEGNNENTIINDHQT